MSLRARHKNILGICYVSELSWTLDLEWKIDKIPPSRNLHSSEKNRKLTREQSNKYLWIMTGRLITSDRLD